MASRSSPSNFPGGALLYSIGGWASIGFSWRSQCWETGISPRSSCPLIPIHSNIGVIEDACARYGKRVGVAGVDDFEEVVCLRSYRNGVHVAVPQSYRIRGRIKIGQRSTTNHPQSFDDTFPRCTVGVKGRATSEPAGIWYGWVIRMDSTTVVTVC